MGVYKSFSEFRNEWMVKFHGATWYFKEEKDADDKVKEIKEKSFMNLKYQGVTIGG